MNFKEFSLAVVGIIAAILVLTAPVACTMHENQLIATQIASGKDPIAVRCAIDGSGGNNNQAVCLMKAAVK